jgi:putative ABC transport system permease protein
VVGNVRRDSLTAPFAPSVYTSALQSPFMATFLLVRSALPPEQVRAIVEDAVRESDPTLALGPVRSIPTLIDRSAAQVRLLTGLLVVFAVVSLILGGVGLYGVGSYAVAMRRREFGIRMAIGATASQVMRDVLRDGFRVTAIGVGAGIVVAFAASLVLRNRFLGIEPLDPVSVLVAASLLCLAGMAATIVPARRATRADPLDALHAE